MKKTSYKTALLEGLIVWTNSILALVFFILLREYYLRNKFPEISALFNIRISLCEIGKFFILFLLWHRLNLCTKVNRLAVLEKEEWVDLGQRIFGSVTVGALLFLLGADILSVNQPHSFFAFFFWLILLAASFVGLMPLAALLRWRKKNRRSKELHHALIVGLQNVRALTLVQELMQPNSGYSLIGFADDIDEEYIRSILDIDHADNHSDFKELVGEVLPIPMICSLDEEEFEKYISENRVDEVFITLPIRSFYDKILTLIKSCQEQGIRTRLINDFFDLQEDAGVPDLSEITVADYNSSAADSRYHPDNMNDLLIDYDFVNQPEFHRDIKRIVDIIFSLAALVMLSPVFLTVAGLIWLQDGWPVLFVQERIGLNKRRFKIFKFRTMIRDAEKLQAELEKHNEVDGAAFKMTEDPRVTKIGNILRKTSLDEIPQFANVLIGDMSIVGPRPLPIRDFERFGEAAHRRRFSVKPGITGLWQVSGRSDVEFDEWMNMDLQYIAEWSLWEDFRILFKTVFVVLQGAGAR
ncbi:MAG: sugar transferase [Candidatus Electrothrix sp. YB6]